MGCLGNSKTEDQRIDEKAQREANKKIEKQLQKERLAYKATHRLLLLGKAAGGIRVKKLQFGRYFIPQGGTQDIFDSI
uniref:GNAS complex locus n=1 Tax=Meleagris gallopavo TaxID=9103 RepID=A0A803Y7H9_MELGA